VVVRDSLTTNIQLHLYANAKCAIEILELINMRTNYRYGTMLQRAIITKNILLNIARKKHNVSTRKFCKYPQKSKGILSFAANSNKFASEA